MTPLLWVAAAAFALTAIAAPEGAAQESAVTVGALLRKAVASHPSLAAAEARIRASRSRTLDLLRPRNPEVEAAIGGSGPFNEVVGGLEMAFPLRPPGEAAALGRTGAAERSVLVAERSLAAAELLAATARGYVELLAAADDEALGREELEVARGVETNARRRLELAMGGDLPVLQAEILADEAQARIEEARGSARTAAARLSALVGGRVRVEDIDAFAAPDGTAQGSSAREVEWELLQSLPASVPEIPAIRVARARTAAAESAIDLARASRRPAPRVGLRAERDTSGELELFLLAGVSLPVFNGGRFAVSAAEAEAEAARHDLRADSLAAVSDLSGALVEHEVARGMLGRLEEESLPRAHRLESAARENVEAGAAAFLIWLEARRSYLDLRRRQLELRRSAAAAALEARRVTGDFSTLLEEP